MNIDQWRQFLRSHDACRDGYAEAHTQTPSEWWVTTKRGDWMIWVLRKSGAPIDKITWVKIAIFCARQSLQYATPGDDRPRLAVEAAESWVACPTPAMESAAESAGKAAAKAAAESAWYAWAAWAAWYAAESVWSAWSDGDAWAAALAAAQAAWYDRQTQTTYRATAEAAVMAAQADYIRSIIPTIPEVAP